MASSTKKKAAAGFGGVLVFILVLSIVFKQATQTVIVSGRSMLPTFKDGQRLLVSNAYWLIGSIKQNDIVVIKERNASGYIIKRVYRLGGEVVDFLNVPRNWPFSKGEYTVPKNMIYVLGDNRAESEDSRSFGPKPVSDVIGKVLVAR